MQPQGILFDLDGTIVFSHPLHFKAYSLLFAEYGVSDWTYEEFQRVFAGTGPAHIIEEVLGRNRIKINDLADLVMRKRLIFNNLMGSEKLDVIPGFVDFFKNAKKQGLPVAVASGSHMANIHAMLKNIGIEKEFNALVGGDMVEFMKPAPDIFLLAASKLNLDPKTCLTIEDSVAGVTSAKSAGTTCIALLTTTGKDELMAAGADKVVRDYYEIKI